MFVVNFDALVQASDIQIERRQVVFLCWMQDLNPGSQTPKHTYMFVVNFDALVQANYIRIEMRQVVFLCWMQNSKPEGLWNRISSKLNARWQTDWAIEDQAENLNSTARSYDQRAFSPLDPTSGWHSHLALAIYMSVVVNFDALAQASDIRIQRRQGVFLCWMQDPKPEGLWNRISSRLNARWQTDWAIEDQAENLNSTARSYDQRAFSPLDPTSGWHSHLALAIYMSVVVNFDALAQVSDIRIQRRQGVFLCWMQDPKPEGLWNRISSRLNARWQTDWVIEDQAKNLNSTARSYDQRAFSPLDPTAGWHSHLALATYKSVVVNFDALAQASDFRIERRQVVFLCWMQDSNQGLRHQIASRLNVRWQTDWAILRIKLKKNELDNRSLWSASIQTTRPHCQLAFAPYSSMHACMFDVVNFDALAQASDFRFEMNLRSLRHQIASRLNAHSQTDWAIEDQAN